MDTPQEHKAYLKKGPHSLQAQVGMIVPKAELVARYGHWLEALAEGKIAPISDPGDDSWLI